MKTGSELFEELDGSPCSHGRGNGWQCFECAIMFIDRIVADARADGYRAGIEDAAKVAEELEAHGTRKDFDHDMGRDVWSEVDIADAIRALAPAKEEP